MAGGRVWGCAMELRGGLCNRIGKAANRQTDAKLPAKKHYMLVCRLLRQSNTHTVEFTIKDSCLKARSLVKFPLDKTNSTYLVSWEGEWSFEEGNSIPNIVDFLSLTWCTITTFPIPCQLPAGP